MAKRFFNGFFGNRQHSVIGPIPKFVSVLYAYVVFQHLLDRKFGERSRELLFRIGKALGKSITAKLKQGLKLDRKRVLENLLKDFEALGFGKTAITRMNFTTPSCHLSNNSPLAKQWKRSFGTQQEPVDHFLAGLYAGAFSHLSGTDCYFKEVGCAVQRGGRCRFRLVTQDPYRGFFSQEELDQELSWDNLYSPTVAEYPNALIRRVVATKQIRLEEGRLSVFNILAHFFPINVYEIIPRALRAKGLDIVPELSCLTHVQAKHAVLFQVNNFGVAKGDESFKAVLNQLYFCGIGKIEVEESMPQRIVVRCGHSYPLVQYRNMAGTSSGFRDWFVEGMIVGAATHSYDVAVTAHESRIEGDDVTYTLRLDGGKGLVEKEKEKLPPSLRRLIDQRMGRKYYLLS
ncbi:hypothetical protein KY327_00250 [Candidatus Woesearchaeota archaeon]|nr:hypothetical protein [Candidatus Woesearchaeota archaeon]